MAESKMQLADVEHVSGLPAYPIDMSLLLTLWRFSLDDAGVASQVHPAGYHPTIIAQYGLAQWNYYLATNDERHSSMFLAQARWLIEHEVHIGNDAGGWPISFPHPDVRGDGSWLSALAQGQALSVLVRAYQLTQEEIFLEVARRVVRTFERDILDGGVSTPMGEEGVFFEEVAVYPATHTLSGFIFALFGLYDYVALTGDVQVKALIQRSLSTMHVLLEELDVGFWMLADLLHRRLVSPSHLTLQTTLLETLATYSGCKHCSMLALRWKSYQRQLRSRLHYLIISRWTSLGNTLMNRMRSILFPKTHASRVLHVCVPITAFPVTGGMHTILEKIAQLTSDRWRIEYLTQHIGPTSKGCVIHQFGKARVFSWQFITVWLYVFAGFGKLLSLMRHGANYHILLPQDGVFTAAFTALVAKLAGVRVVCIDHGNLTLLQSRIYRTERAQDLATRQWPFRLLARLLYVGYWPSLYLLARFAARFVDHFLMPGVAGDSVEEICKQLGIHTSRITRFANVIDLSRHVIPDAALRINIREKIGIAADAIVVTMISRLATEKRHDIALKAISQALSVLSPESRARVRVIIAGDGPMRKEIEENIHAYGLDQTCRLWGEASAAEVISLLGISDIFLYTSNRGTGYPLAILEAMASGCALIASAEPLVNSRMLAKGRGIVVPVEDIEQTSKALVTLLNDPQLCRSMGSLARDYIAAHHSGIALERALLRVTYWATLDELLHVGIES